MTETMIDVSVIILDVLFHCLEAAYPCLELIHERTDQIVSVICVFKFLPFEMCFYILRADNSY